nr:hypothetical protein Iba_chr02dCG7150 [Ipomoea batatas]
MGACASRPKDLKKGAPPPSESEAPITPEKPAEVVDPATATAPLQDETTNKELIEPLVDVSEVPAAPEANTKARVILQHKGVMFSIPKAATSVQVSYLLA